MLAWAFELAGRRGAIGVLSQLRLELVERRLRHEPQALDGAESAELAAVAVQGIEPLEAYFGRFLPQIVLALIVPVAILCWIVPIDATSALVMVLTLPLVPLFMVLIGRYTAQKTRARAKALTVLATRFLDVVRGLPTLRAYNRGEAQATSIAETSEQYRQATMGTLRVAFLSGAVLELAATLGIALVAVTVGVRLVDGGIGYEAALVVLLLAPELYLPLRTLGAQYHASADGRRRRRAAAGAHRARARGDSRARQLLGCRTARSCDSRASPTHIPRATASCSTAWISSSTGARRSRSSARAGAGRARSPRSSSGSRIPPTGGCWWAGQSAPPTTSRPGVAASPGCRSARRSSAAPLRTTSVSATRTPTTRLFVPLPGSPAPTPSSTRFPTATRPEWGTGADLCPQAKLSASRSPARSLRDAELVVLDEPTANLDPANAEAIGGVLQQLSVGRTVLVIAHRPELAQRADRIVRLANGRVVDERDAVGAA